MLSSSYVYGALPDNPYYVDEEYALNVSRTYPEVRDLAEVDTLCTAFLWRHPEIATTILRPVSIARPHVHSSMAQYLRQRYVPTIMGFDPMMQFIHEEDVAEAVALALQSGTHGVFNVVGPGAVPLSVAIHQTGGTALPIPEPLARLVFGQLFNLGLYHVPPGAIDFVKYPCTLDGRRFRERHRLHAAPFASRTSSPVSVADVTAADGRAGSSRGRRRSPRSRSRRSRTRSTPGCAASRPHLNAYGYDAFGFSPVAARRALVLSALLYRYWFRVETHGIERLPQGRMLLISNHAGQIAIDAAMIGTAMVLEAEPPRIIRGMGEYWLPTVPWINIAMVRTGSVVGTPQELRRPARGGRVRDRLPRGRARHEQADLGALPAAGLRLRLHAPGARDAHPDRADRGRRLGGAGAGHRQPARARAAARHARVPGDAHLAVARARWA